MTVTVPLVVDPNYFATLAKFKAQPNWNMLARILRDNARDLSRTVRNGRRIHERTLERLQGLMDITLHYDCPNLEIIEACAEMRPILDHITIDEIRELPLLRRDLVGALATACEHLTRYLHAPKQTERTRPPAAPPCPALPPESQPADLGAALVPPLPAAAAHDGARDL